MKELQIDEIEIWTDNPRIGTVMSEHDAINTLIEVVSEKKMLNLANDICSKGLSPAELPVVVYKNGKYLVYDGNRRFTVIKCILNPEIIEDDFCRSEFEKLNKNHASLLPSKYVVCLTSEQEAYRLMDLAHSGEQEGVGRLPWSALQRDISLVKRNLPPNYPVSYSIVNALKWNTEQDFNYYPKYTDIQRIFDSTLIKNFLDIPDYNNLNDSLIEKIHYLMDKLKEYKDIKRFKSFSRHFNEISDEPNNNLYKFIEWIKSLENSNGEEVNGEENLAKPDSNEEDYAGSDEKYEESSSDNDNSNEHQPSSEIDIIDPIPINPSYDIFIANKLGITQKEFDIHYDFKLRKMLYEIQFLSGFTNQHGYKYSMSLVSLWRMLIENISKQTIELIDNSFVFNSSVSLECLINNINKHFNSGSPNSLLDSNDTNIQELINYFSNNNDKSRMTIYITSANGSMHNINYYISSDRVMEMYNNSMPYMVTCLKYIVLKNK